MSLLYLRVALVVLAATVFIRQVFAAKKTFTRLNNEGFTPPVLIMMTANAVAVGMAALAPLNSPLLVLAGGVGLSASLLLYEWARRSIKGRMFTPFFSNDIPEFVWTGGPYAYVRHPFYASYLLAYSSVAVALRTYLPLFLLLGMAVFFWLAVTREERKFSNSAMSTEYEAYKRRTGRFLPRVLPARAVRTQS